MQRAKDYNFVVLLSAGDGAVAGSAVAVSVLSEQVQLPDQSLVTVEPGGLHAEQWQQSRRTCTTHGGIDFVYCHFQVRVMCSRAAEGRDDHRGRQ